MGESGFDGQWFGLTSDLRVKDACGRRGFSHMTVHMTVRIEAACPPRVRWGSSSSAALYPSFFPPLTHYPNRPTSNAFIHP
ncbi:hypothetical protein PAXINDRAFT_19022 [Paxillus involutus ATCC 200175]|uniref:Uncharacterized protein n=1 Tax=Paxillus involutus ATCC 200175 TaxID=664439 RepID=A0A0C9TKC3_PAXIN|nr:hypothetical protein PAXINDRAFT_19022 [Paxillus involutus ATCC 200175]